MATDVKVEMVKCACPDCVCVVNVASGIQRNGHIYCSDACADHHTNGTGCGHAGSGCHG